jgi:hypothetical protein
MPSPVKDSLETLLTKADRRHDGLALFLAGADFSGLHKFRTADPLAFNRDNVGRTTTFITQQGRGVEFEFDGIVSNIVRVDLNRKQVRKIAHPRFADGHFAREAHWLKALQQTGIAPEVLRLEARSLTTSYLGEPVSIYNLPFDWRIQAERLLAALDRHDCCHNDIKSGNVIVGRRRLYLIDFEWATLHGAALPDVAPPLAYAGDDRGGLFSILEATEEAADAAQRAPREGARSN